MNKCLVKNQYCLNKKDGKNTLRHYINNTINKGFINSNRKYGFYLNNKNINQTFHIKINYPNNEKIFLYIYVIKKTIDKNEFCLKMEFIEPKKSGNNYTFNQSIIHGIYRGMCALSKKTKNKGLNMKGPYIVQLADTINKILQVKKSILLDDSRLEICLKENGTPHNHMFLGIIKLLQSGKTWYHREIGFEIDDPKVYELTSIVQKIPLSSLFNIVRNKQLHSLGELYLNYQNQIDRVNEILKKVNLSEKNNFKEITKIIFNSKTNNISDCERVYIYDKIISASLKRKKVHIYKKEDILNDKEISQKDLDNYKILMDWWSIALSMHWCTKIY
jgi:hypothetical protein